MTRVQFWVILAAAVAAGLIGGAFSDRFFNRRAEAVTGGLVNATELRLVDERGRTRALLSLLRGKPRLIMTDEKGEFRLELGIGEGGEPAVRLRDADGRGRIELALTGQGSPSLDLSDAAGRNRISLGLNSVGYPALFMRDDAGRERLALWQEKSQLGLAMADEQGRPRAGLAMKKDGVASLAFYADDGQVLWYAPSKK